jgi:hypothetical protein
MLEPERSATIVGQAKTLPLLTDTRPVDLLAGVGLTHPRCFGDWKPLKDNELDSWR